jgi:hypothetical protein
MPQGRPAYSGMRAYEVKQVVLAGKRPPLRQLADSQPELADIISRCWAQAPADRPSFAAVLVEVEGLLQQWLTLQQTNEDTTMINTYENMSNRY